MKTDRAADLPGPEGESVKAGLPPEIDDALRLLARLLVRAYLKNRNAVHDAPERDCVEVLLDFPLHNKDSLDTMTGDEES